MFTVKILMLSLLLLTSGVHASSRSNDASPIFIVYENGGATAGKEERQQATKTILNLLAQASQLGKRKSTRNTPIILIATHQPHGMLWTGTAEQLLASTKHVKKLLTFHDGYSDLTRAYELINTTIALRGISTMRIYHVGSFINIPITAGSGKITVEVPQDIPADLALSKFSSKVTTLSLLNVRKEQKVTLQIYLESIGLLERKAKGTLNLNVFEATETNANLKRLL